MATPNGGVANLKMRVGGDVAEEFTYTPYYVFGRNNYFGEWEVSTTPPEECLGCGNFKSKTSFPELTKCPKHHQRVLRFLIPSSNRP